MSITQQDSKSEAPDRKLNWALAGLLALALLIRLRYLAPGLMGVPNDSIGYAFGGLGMWVAHPPGFFGYCFLGWLVNQVIGNINHSFLLINVTSCMVGIYCCHKLALSFKLSPRRALLATAAYGFSINTIYFSDIALSYAPEGMFATAMALSAHRAINLKSLKWGLMATFIWAISGAFRQTSTAFLTPLWLFMLLRARPLKAIPLHILVAVPLIAGWSYANTFYLNAAAGNPEKGIAAWNFWALQVMMPSNYDPTKLGLDEDSVQEASSQYHWPFMEILTWVDEKLGTHILPSYQSFAAPPPDLGHAGRLILLQFLKLSFYTIFSMPVLLVSLAYLFFLRRKHPLLPKTDWLFLAAWIVPPAMFFLVGHFGSFGYLQIYLSGLAILSVILIGEDLESTSDAPRRLRFGDVALVASPLLSVLFFLLATPFDTADTGEKLADVLALQYSGPSILKGVSYGRSTSNKPGRPEFPEWFKYRSDSEIVALWERNNPEPKSIFRPHVRR